VRTFRSQRVRRESRRGLNDDYAVRNPREGAAGGHAGGVRRRVSRRACDPVRRGSSQCRRPGEALVPRGARACNKPCNNLGKFSLIQPHAKSQKPCKAELANPADAPHSLGVGNPKVGPGSLRYRLAHVGGSGHLASRRRQSGPNALRSSGRRGVGAPPSIAAAVSVCAAVYAEYRIFVRNCNPRYDPTGVPRHYGYVVRIASSRR
jgi:hypothetical protein